MAIPTILIFFVALPIVVLIAGGFASGPAGVLMVALFTILGFGSLRGLLGMIEFEENNSPSA